MNSLPAAKVNAAIDLVVRESWSQTLSALVYRIRDFQLSEDVLQDAILSAWKSWPNKGIPNSPQSWLYQTALRKAIDQIRRRENFESKRPQIEILHELESEKRNEDSDTEIPDERLRLIFTCCHPAIEKRSSVALTLRAVCGLTTKEIARAFLDQESTLGQRLTRAKRKIRDAGIPYRVPPPELWEERLESVLSVIYFIFNEGYQASSGEALLRVDLCEEAIRLARILTQLAPTATEASGLLALMLLHHARHASRIDENGEFIPLEYQDRSLWNRAEIEEGDAILKSSLSKKSVGPYQIQAAISALHAKATDWESTDWIQIERLYETLHRLQSSPVVRLNQYIAISMIDGPQAGLTLLAQLAEPLTSYQPYHAAKADLRRRLSQIPEALASYQTALKLTSNQAEQKFLQHRIHTLEG
ncbi:MAG: RNA polymerase sigma factor [Verrucomicrobiota bacterium]